MKFLKSLLSSRSFKGEPSESYSRLVIDLTEHRCGHSQLGYPPSEADFFTRLLIENEIFEDVEHGFEVGMKRGKLNYVLITLNRFKGRFRYRGRPVDLTEHTTVDDVRTRFGEPYWQDDDRDEILLFYEDGTVELQFEFPGKHKLGYITILIEPVMVDPAQRNSYGVSKPWPP